MSVRDVLLDADQNARTEAIRLEATGQLPPGFVDQHYGLTNLELRELRRLKHAGAAATDADTYVALAKGRSVDSSRLNPTMVSYLRRNA